MSIFAAAAAAAAATHDAITGDLFEYHPMRRALGDRNAPHEVDPAREVILNLLMPFGASAARTMSGPAKMVGVKPETPGHTSSRPFVSLPLARLPYRPVQGDRLVRQDTGAVYQVAEVLLSTPGFARLDLNHLRD